MDVDPNDLILRSNQPGDSETSTDYLYSQTSIDSPQSSRRLHHFKRTAANPLACRLLVTSLTRPLQRCLQGNLFPALSERDTNPAPNLQFALLRIVKTQIKTVFGAISESIRQKYANRLENTLLSLVKRQIGPVFRGFGKTNTIGGYRKIDKIGKGLALLQSRLQKHAGYSTISNSKLTKALLSDFSLSALTRITRSFQTKLKSTAFERVRLVGNWKRTVLMVLEKMGVKNRERNMRIKQKMFYKWEKTREKKGNRGDLRQFALNRVLRLSSHTYPLNSAFKTWIQVLFSTHRRNMKRIKAGLIGNKLNSVLNQRKRNMWTQIRRVTHKSEDVYRKIRRFVGILDTKMRENGRKWMFYGLKSNFKVYFERKLAIKSLFRMISGRENMRLTRNFHKFYTKTVLFTLKNKRKVWKKHQSARLIRFSLLLILNKTHFSAFFQLKSGLKPPSKPETRQISQGENLVRSTKLMRALYKLKSGHKIAEKEAFNRWIRCLIRKNYQKLASNSPKFEDFVEIFETPKRENGKIMPKTQRKLSKSAQKRVEMAKSGLRLGKIMENIGVRLSFDRLKRSEAEEKPSLAHKSGLTLYVLSGLVPQRWVREQLRECFTRLKYPFLAHLPVLEALLCYRKQVARHSDLHCSVLKWRQYMRDWRLKERKRAVVARHILGKLNRKYETVGLSWAFYTLQSTPRTCLFHHEIVLKTLFRAFHKQRFRLLLDAYRYCTHSKWSQHRRLSPKSTGKIHHKRSSCSTATSHSVTSTRHMENCLGRGCRMLPLPGSIHDYIDDVVEVGREKGVEALYSAAAEGSMWRRSRPRGTLLPRNVKPCRTCGHSLVKSTKGSDGIGSDLEDFDLEDLCR